MAWAAVLGREGKTDQAVAVYRVVTAPGLRKPAANALAALLYKVSATEVGLTQFAPAILRLEEIIRIAPDTPGGVLVSSNSPSIKPRKPGCWSRPDMAPTPCRS